MSESTKLHDAACPEPQQLPAEVWAKIFRKMTIEDWARAAGTTQASWAANPYPHSTCFVSLTSACVPGLEGAHAALGFLTLPTVLRATGITMVRARAHEKTMQVLMPESEPSTFASH